MEFLFMLGFLVGLPLLVTFGIVLIGQYMNNIKEKK